MPVAQKNIRLVFQKLERDLIKLSSRQKPETVHSFRTGARRLQTLLEQLLPERDRNQKRLLKVLGRIRKRAGKLRDLDVQLVALRSLKVPQEPRRKTQLVHALLDLREESENKLRKLLTKQMIREARKRLNRARRDLKPANLRDPLQTAGEMLSHAPTPDGPVTEDTLHQCRLLAKRARYVAEFASRSPDADRMIAQLKRAQDALGDWHDWFTLTNTATHRLGAVHESPLVAVLHNLTAAKFRKAVSAVPVAKPSGSPPKRASSKTLLSRKLEAKTAGAASAQDRISAA